MDSVKSSPQWQEVVYRVLVRQSLAGVLLVLAVYIRFDLAHALSVLLGVVLVEVNTWWMARVAFRDSSQQKDLYKSAVLRYLMFFVVLLVSGWLGVKLLATLAGMFLAYMVLYFYSASFLVGLKKAGTD